MYKFKIHFTHIQAYLNVFVFYPNTNTLALTQFTSLPYQTKGKDSERERERESKFSTMSTTIELNLNALRRW